MSDTKKMMMGAAAVLAALTMGMFAAGRAQATMVDVDFGFDLNSVAAEPLFLYDNNALPASSDDTLTASSTADLTVDIDGVNAATFTGAQFNFAASVNSITSLGGTGIQTFEVELSGAFSFDTAGGDPILSAAFNNAVMYLVGLQVGPGVYTILSPSSVLSTSALEGTAIYTAQAELQTVLAGLTLTTPQDFFFTATDFGGAGGGAVTLNEINNGADFAVDDFVFDSSYSGTSNAIPEPATLALIGLGGLMMIRRK